MKIITWNCNMAFRNKYHELEDFDADILVIQECENPAQSKDENYKNWAKNYMWVGDIHFKGLGVFAKENIKLEKLECDDQYKFFIPIKVNNTFNLLAVWAMPKYIEELHGYYNANRELFNEKLVMCGDFNSNSIFDREHKNKNHSMLVHYLKKDGLHDCYHFLNKEAQGREKQATFYQTRHLNQPFHLDHVFTAPYIIKGLKIQDHYKWVNLSDHLPVIFEINEDKF